MLWCKQLYHYDVARWLDGDPGQPPPPADRAHGRNAGWRTFDAFDIMSMPDKWEYPWFAAWDSAFHCVALAHVDPAFAKYQLILLCREWFQHPNGALPAYEWAFDDVNPPVQAWAALEVFRIDGSRDREFLVRVFDKLLVNFTWWVNRQDADGDNLFEGGFLGLDNIGPIDRSHLPAGLARWSSPTARAGWRFYTLSMAAIAELGLGRMVAAPTWGSSSSSTSRSSRTPSTARGCGTRRTASTTTGSARPTARRGREGALDGRHRAAARAWRPSHEARSTGLRACKKRFARTARPAARGDRTSHGRAAALVR